MRITQSRPLCTDEIEELDMARQRILIVEDSPTMRQLLVFALKRLKDVEIVEACLSELRPHYRDVILMRDYVGGKWEDVRRWCDGSSVEAVRMLHARALTELSRLVKGRTDGAGGGAAQEGSGTPPGRARSGKMCPGRTRSRGRVSGSTILRRVRARSSAEIPVAVPCR